MLKHFLLYSIIAAFSHGALAQCPPFDVHTGFTTQEQIDEFIINYPNCTVLNTNVLIGKIFSSPEFNYSINDLSGFKNITEINGDLYIWCTRNLKNLSGLQNITTITGNLRIASNDSLTSLENLEKITALNESLYIQGNKTLTSLEALRNLNSIGKSLSIANNDNLRNLKGLEKITKLNENLLIEGNIALNSFEGLQNISSIEERLEIIDNPVLNNFEELHNIVFIGSKIIISDNNTLNSLVGLMGINDFRDVIIIRNNDALVNLDGLQKFSNIGSVFVLENASLASLEGLQNLSTLEFYLEIFDNGTLLNLDALNKLKSVGSLSVKNNNELICIKGLNNLTLTGDLAIEDNDKLETLNGLENLTTVFWNFNISNNESLINIESLHNISQIGSNITIQGNNKLPNLKGLENIKTINGSLDILENQSLVSLEGFENLTTIEDYVKIIGNSALLNFKGLESLITIRSYVSILNNGLRNFSGLGSISKVKGLNISDNYNLINLKGFENLKTIERNFKVENNNALINFEGLQTLETIQEDFYVEENEALVNFEGLQNLTTIGENFEIIDNSNLFNLTGLDNLSDIGSNFEVVSNDRLNSLTGVENLNTVGLKVRIVSNKTLNNINGIQNITNLGKYFSIAYNRNLSLCDALCERIGSNLDKLSLFKFQVNLTGCDNVYEVLESCDNLAKVQSQLFYDVNKNKVQDTDEPFAALANINLQPGDIKFAPNYASGLAQHYLTPSTYTFSIDQNNLTNWRLTTDSVQYTLTLVEDTCIQIEFGFYPEELISNVNTTIYYPNNRCNETIPFDISAHNTGSTITSGTLWLQVDTLIPSIIQIDAIDTIVQPNLYGWFFEDLPPRQQIAKKIRLLIPGPPDFEIGDYLNYSSYSDFKDVNGQHKTSIYDYRTRVRCSYDPNDKLVNPKRLCDYTLFEDTLVYTIRFQNTGNDFARDVVIRDTLDANLDLNTFTLLGSSHPEVLSTSLKDFDYKNCNPIMLKCVEFTTPTLICVPGFCKLDDYREFIFDVESAFDCNAELVTNSCIKYTAFPGLEGVDTVFFYGTDVFGAVDTIVSYITIIEDCDNYKPLVINENRLATFEFKNIILPDSTSNLEESQGYVNYMISPKVGLAENTIIKNSSGIYFDSNPPIYTNTVSNVLVNKLPNTTWCRDADMDGLGNAMDVVESCEQPMGYVSDCSDPDDTILSIDDYKLSSEVSIYPNPSSGSFRIVFDEVSFKNAKFNIYNSAGAEVVAQNPINRKNQFYDYQHLANGVYYINIHLDEENVIRKKLLVLK